MRDIKVLSEPIGGRGSQKKENKENVAAADSSEM
jgi:hypothetical protein